MLLEKYKEKPPDNPKIFIPTNYLDLARCIIPDKEKVNAAPNDQKFIIHLTEHSGFRVKPSCSKPEKAKN